MHVALVASSPWTPADWLALVGLFTGLAGVGIGASLAHLFAAKERIDRTANEALLGFKLAVDEIDPVSLDLRIWGTSASLGNPVDVLESVEKSGRVAEAQRLLAAVEVESPKPFVQDAARRASITLESARFAAVRWARYKREYLEVDSPENQAREQDAQRNLRDMIADCRRALETFRSAVRPWPPVPGLPGDSTAAP